MKHLSFFISFLILGLSATGQLKMRPDAFPPAPESLETKAISMATTPEEMKTWDRYPTYDTYLAMMAGWVEEFPTLCHVDTIGTSVRGRLILSMYIETQGDEEAKPEFFYSSTIHGDEVTGYVMMLRLIDTLLRSYGEDERITSLIDATRISINPLANPDGTYYRGNQSIQGARRNNANNVDLNRNYPDPFAPAKAALQQENQAMINYLSEHHFRLSANLHGGAEVMNYPWDSFTSQTVRSDADQMSHPAEDWWIEVCKRFVDTSRTYNDSHFRDTYTCGYTAGGDWYPISGGRQDYVNAVHNCLEMTMEISTQKTLSSDRLPEYWRFLAPSFINYIAEIHNLPEIEGIDNSELRIQNSEIRIYPNPTTGVVTLGGAEGSVLELLDLQGHTILTHSTTQSNTLDISHLDNGIYFLRMGGKTAKIIKL